MMLPAQMDCGTIQPGKEKTYGKLGQQDAGVGDRQIREIQVQEETQSGHCESGLFLGHFSCLPPREV